MTKIPNYASLFQQLNFSGAKRFKISLFQKLDRLVMGQGLTFYAINARVLSGMKFSQNSLQLGKTLLEAAFTIRTQGLPNSNAFFFRKCGQDFLSTDQCFTQFFSSIPLFYPSTLIPDKYYHDFSIEVCVASKAHSYKSSTTMDLGEHKHKNTCETSY